MVEKFRVGRAGRKLICLGLVKILVRNHHQLIMKMPIKALTRAIVVYQPKNDKKVEFHNWFLFCVLCIQHVSVTGLTLKLEDQTYQVVKDLARTSAQCWNVFYLGLQSTGTPIALVQGVCVAHKAGRVFKVVVLWCLGFYLFVTEATIICSWWVPANEGS